MYLTEEQKSELFNEFMEKINDKVKLYVHVCQEGVELPEYANIGDAGMDIRAAEDITIKPGETVIIKTGLKMIIPKGYEIQIRPRSGLSFKTPLRVPNSPGTIDAGYRDEIGVIMYNASTSGEEIYSINDKGNKQGCYLIKKGDRIAQAVLAKYGFIDFELVEDEFIQSFGENRGGGFGHSGTN